MDSAVEASAACLNCGRSLRDGTLCECVDTPLYGPPLYVCENCAPTAILNTESLNRIYGEIVRALNAFDTRLFVMPAPAIQLVGASEVRWTSGDERTIGLYVNDPDQPLIMVARGFEYWKTFAILAHEYGHAWQGAYIPGYQMIEPEIVEGFAEWMAAKALVSAGRPSTRIGPSHAGLDDIYIQGLARFQNMETQHGINGVLTLAATGNPLQAASPLGYDRIVTPLQTKGKSRPH